MQTILIVNIAALCLLLITDSEVGKHQTFPGDCTKRYIYIGIDEIVSSPQVIEAYEASFHFFIDGEEKILEKKVELSEDFSVETVEDLINLLRRHTFYGKSPQDPLELAACFFEEDKSTYIKYHGILRMKDSEKDSIFNHYNNISNRLHEKILTLKPNLRIKINPDKELRFKLYWIYGDGKICLPYSTPERGCQMFFREIKDIFPMRGRRKKSVEKFLHLKHIGM